MFSLYPPLQHYVKKLFERHDGGGVSIVSRYDAASRTGGMLNGEMTKASNK